MVITFRKIYIELLFAADERNIREKTFQVEFKKESLNKGDVFILDLGRDIYVWMPPDSGRLERIRVRIINP